MKKLLSVLLISIIALSSFAHTINPTNSCGFKDGNYGITGTQFEANQKVSLTVETGFTFSLTVGGDVIQTGSNKPVLSNSNRTITFFTTTGGSSKGFTVLIKQVLPNVTDFITSVVCVYGSSNTAAQNSPLQTKKGNCSTGGLPVKLINFVVKRNTDYTTSVSWTTTFEANNNYFIVEGSNDGSTFHQQAIVFSKYEDGNSGIATDYSYKIEATVLSKVVAGMGGLAFVLLIGMLIGKIKTKRSWFFAPLMGLILAGSLVSCQKTYDKPADKATVKWKFVRLKQVDKDGTEVIATSIISVK